MKNLIYIITFAILQITISLSQTVPYCDPKFEGKQAYIRPTYVDNNWCQSPSILEFVDSNTTIINTITLKPPKTHKKTMVINGVEIPVVYQDRSSVVFSKSKKYAAVNEFTVEYKGEEYFNSSGNFPGETGYYGIERVNVTIYDTKGDIVFQKTGVPYEILAISDDGEYFCAIIPIPALAENEDAICYRREMIEDSLKYFGKMYLFDKGGKTIFEKYFYAGGQPEIIFSPKMKWFLFLYASDLGYVYNVETGKNKNITIGSMIRPRLINEIGAYYKTTGGICDIDDNGKLIIKTGIKDENGKLTRIGIKEKVKILWYKVYYDVFTDSLTKGELWSE